MLIVMFFAGWLISAVVVYGTLFAYLQGACSCSQQAQADRRGDIGLSVLTGCGYGCLGPIGIFIAACLSGFWEHGWRLADERIEQLTRDAVAAMRERCAKEEEAVRAVSVRAAVEAMRERCARIAEATATKDGEDWHDNSGQGSWDSACDSIADKIRSGE